MSITATVDALNLVRATPETLLEVMTTSVYEVSGDKTRSQMLSDLEHAVGQENVQKLISELEKDSRLVHETALAWISVASNNASQSDAIKSAIQNSDRNAVLIETAAIAVVALYALYLAKTGGIKEIKETIERKPDGSFREKRDVLYSSFSAPLKALFDAIGMSNQQ